MKNNPTDYLVARRFDRFKLDVRLRITPVLRGVVFFGRTLEVSCCGLSMVSAAEFQLGEIVDLAFKIAECEISVRAAVRNRTGARYGIEFLTLSAEQRLHIASATQGLPRCGEDDWIEQLMLNKRFRAFFCLLVALSRPPGTLADGIAFGIIRAYASPLRTCISAGMVMDRPHCCPICNEFRVRTTLTECDITAKFKDESREVHGLASFSCENGHIFFVRMADLVIDREPPSTFRHHA
jgi:PilZ domain